MKGKIANPKNETGAALVVALIMLIVLTLIGLAAMFTSTFEVILSGNKRGATDAFYSAESGIQVVVGNLENFDLPGKYVNNQYNPFTDPKNPNPTQANVTITYFPDRAEAPRGSGYGATGQFEFVHYQIDSIGQDQLDQNPMKANCEIREKVVRLIPTLQGGN
ncbi:MAG: pilus assembly PilX N-terminal domain-containing protein [Candidatus Anstonellales archaeon]